MGDVKLAASTPVSKTSVSVDHSRVGSMPLTEAPAFIVPPRNLCIREGATAKFEGRVRSMAGGEAGGEMGQGHHLFFSSPFLGLDLAEGQVFFGPTRKVNIFQFAQLLFVYD